MAERIVQLWESGVPSSTIARRLGISRKQVNNTIKEHIKKGVPK